MLPTPRYGCVCACVYMCICACVHMPVPTCVYLMFAVLSIHAHACHMFCMMPSYAQKVPICTEVTPLSVSQIKPYTDCMRTYYTYVMIACFTHHITITIAWCATCDPHLDPVPPLDRIPSVSLRPSSAFFCAHRTAFVHTWLVPSLRNLCSSHICSCAFLPSSPCPLLSLWGAS